MHKGTLTPHQMSKIQRKCLKKLAKLCPAFCTIKALVTSPEPMKLKILCTDTFVLHASPMEKLSIMQKSIARINLKNCQKTNKLGCSFFEHSRSFL